jgi:hypothetical protein
MLIGCKGSWIKVVHFVTQPTFKSGEDFQRDWQG